MREELATYIQNVQPIQAARPACITSARQAEMPRCPRTPEPLGILTVHASAVRINGEALIFLGPCGTGKTTMWQLLSNRAQLIADDKTYLIPQGDGEWGVADATVRSLTGPLSDQEALSLEGVPLRAILRLYQASKPRLERIDACATCRHLTDAYFALPWQQEWDSEIKRLVFANLAAIARRVPGYLFYFAQSHRSAGIIIEEVARRPHAFIERN